ncbi:MAG: CotH kinase family protein [Eubacteriales bacterium]|nr:CotH kinase family protein [Eubacteriales bacterium]
MRKMKRKWKRNLSLLLAVVIIAAGISRGKIGVTEVKAAGNGPLTTYTFEQLVEMSNIPVMNLTLADPEEYDALKTVKDKQNISRFELANTNGKGEDISLEATVDETSGKAVYPLTAKGRGNSSWTMPTGKKPYNLKFDKKQDLLGMGKAKSWCLIANWVDTTFLRNYMAYQLACALGMGTPDCEMVALCIDGEFEGIYLLTEKVGLNEYRTEIPAGENDGDKNGDGVVTEIIVESDSRAYENAEPGAFTTAGGVYFVPKDPDPEDLGETELAEIEKEINAMEAAILSGTNYEQFIDVDSWVDTYIVNELAKNPDFGFGYQACYSSSYLYFREGGKVYAGPVWDFDIAYGRNNYGILEAEGYRDTAGAQGYLTRETKYYKELFENTDFEERVIKRWKQIRETILPVWAEDTFQEGYEAAKALSSVDFEIWGDYTARVAGTFDVGRSTLDFEGEAAYVKAFIQDRIAWLDTVWNVDEVEKKYSGTWTRWDTSSSGGYRSYDELTAAFSGESIKNDPEDIWDGGYGGTEKSGTQEIVRGEMQEEIPAVDLAEPVTIRMEPQRQKNSWDDNYTVVSNVYEWWKDKEAGGGLGNKADLSLTVEQSGRYVGVTSQLWYLGNDTPFEMGEKTQVYIADVGTDGSVTLYDGQLTISESAREVRIAGTNYGKLEAGGDGFVVSFQADQSGNTGTALGGTGEKQFGIYLPEEVAPAQEDGPGEGCLKVTLRPETSNYPDVPLKQEITYIQTEGESPSEWSVEGDSVLFDEATGKVTAIKEGAATITAKTKDGLESSVRILVVEEISDRIEYEADPARGKYFGNGEDVALTATAEEQGSWATIRPGTLTRLNYRFTMTEAEAANASDFTWKTKDGSEIIGGAAEYYVFVNGSPLFAAAADGSEVEMKGFDASNTAVIGGTAIPEGKCAYMQGKAGSTKDMLKGMEDLVQADENNIDIFIDTKDGCATARPYFAGKNRVDAAEPEEPDDPDKMEYDFHFLNRPDAIQMADMSTYVLYTEFEPADVPDKNVKWTCSDPAVVGILGNGLLIAKKPGTVVIEAVSEYNPKKSAFVTVTVYPAAVTVKATGSQYTTVGKDLILEAAVSPRVSDQTVKWSVIKGEECAILEGNVLKPVKAGVVTVKAVSNYNPQCDTTVEIVIEGDGAVKTVYAPIYSKETAEYPVGAVVYYPGDECYYVYHNPWAAAYQNTGAFPGAGWSKVTTDLSGQIREGANEYYHNDLGTIIQKDGRYYTPLGDDYWEHWINPGGNNAYWNIVPDEYAQYFGTGIAY